MSGTFMSLERLDFVSAVSVIMVARQNDQGPSGHDDVFRFRCVSFRFSSLKR